MKTAFIIVRAVRIEIKQIYICCTAHLGTFFNPVNCYMYAVQKLATRFANMYVLHVQVKTELVLLITK